MKITKVLREYKEKKALVETTIARINHLKQLLKKSNLEELEYYAKTYLNLGVQKSNLNISPVENEIFGKLHNNNLTRQLVQEWISEDRIKIIGVQIELEQVGMALTALTRFEKFIIECKYFDRMQWKEIELSVDETFGIQRTDEGLGKKHDEALRKLIKILKPFYEKIA